jgi:hypothetical protein
MACHSWIINLPASFSEGKIPVTVTVFRTKFKEKTEGEIRKYGAKEKSTEEESLP